MKPGEHGMRAFCVTVAEADEDQAVAALWEAGTAGVEVRPAPGGRLRLLAYFAGDSEAPSRAALPRGATVEPAEVDDVDWVARFREGFHAFRAGRFLVAPPWDLPGGQRGSPASDHAPTASPDSCAPEDRGPSTGATLIVDPGRAFGTGTHETTRLCLAALEYLADRRALGRTLDLGAGTGLLAVAALRLGASFVCASDIDPEATASSRHHARLNGGPLRVVRADGGRGLRPGSFDLVLANLMALLLVDRAAEIRALLAPGGALVLSGLLVGDVPFVRDAFATCGLTAEPRAESMTSRLPTESHADETAASSATTNPPASTAASRQPAASGNPSVIVEGEWAALVYEDVT